MDTTFSFPELASNTRVRAILEKLSVVTGMGFVGVAHVTEQRWMACQTIDTVGFGLNAGDELEIGTTICNEIRQTGVPVFIDCVDDEPNWRVHPIPVMYGFQSYISVPVYRDDGSFFGTLCAIDNEPRQISGAATVRAIEQLARDLAESLPLDGVH